MNNIINYVKLDFYTVKSYRKQMLFLLLFPIFFIFLKFGTSTITAILLGYITVVASYPFSISEANNLEILYESLPLNRRTVVLGRYIFSGLVLISAVILCILIYALKYFLMGESFYLPEAIFSNGIILIIFTFMLSCQMHIYFRFGYIKAKLLNFLLPFFVFFFVSITIFIMDNIFSEGSFINFINSLSENLTLFSIILVFLPFLFISISCRLSQGYYLKRDLL